MIRMRLSEIAACCDGRLHGDDVVVEGVATDSRSVRPGMLFAALPGKRVDGHDFIGAAAASGAAAVLSSRRVRCPVPAIRTPDVLRALGSIAGAWRGRLDPLVIGITGSNGKTTSKEMLYNILRRRRHVLATQGNFNNELGLPLTLFDLDEAHSVAVLEMGASRAGDIAYLADIARPRIAVVTNIGPAHLEGFGDTEGVARAKGEIYSALPGDGVAVMNGDEPWLNLWSTLSGAGQRLLFGIGASCDVRAEPSEDGCIVRTPSGSFPLRLALPGEHNLQNALAAAALAVAAGETNEDIRAGLEATRPVPGRLNLLRAPGGWTVIDDTYNANPASLYAALQVLAAEGGEPWLVLGDMAELGASSRKLHAEVGDAAVALGVLRVYATGEASRSTVEAYGEGARHFPSRQALLKALLADLRPGVTCLVKGSRSMGMERVALAIARAGAIRETG